MSYKYTTNTAEGIIYYNATITNETNTSYQTIPAEFLQSMDQAILDQPKLYNLAITRFNVSSQSIPFWIVPIQLNQADPNLTPYSVALSYKSPLNNTASTGEVYLRWYSEQAAPYYSGGVIKVQQLDSGYYFSYSRQDFIDMFNDALEVAFQTLYDTFTALYPLDPTPPPLISQFTAPNVPSPHFPFLNWNESLNKFQMYFNLTMFAGDNPIEIFVNNLLYPLIQFPADNRVYNRPVDSVFAYKIEIPQNNNYYTPTFYQAYPNIEKYPYVITYSDHDTLGLFSPLRSIVITSNTLPTQNEILQPATNPFFTTTPSAVSQLLPLKMVSDFEPDLFSQNQINRDFIQYNQSINNSRLISFCNHNVAINQIDIKFWWSDFNNIIRPIYLYSGSSMDIKLAFVPVGYIKTD